MDDSLALRVLEQGASRRQQRRDFFRKAGGFAAGAASIAAIAASAGRHSGLVSEAEAQVAMPSDGDILNFALNFEYLEANFYSYATTGSPIDASLTSGVGTQGAATGGAQVPFSDPVVAAFARELAQDELRHINFLRSTLGGAAVAQPAIDLSTTPTSPFSLAAQSAGVVPAGQAYNPFDSDNDFLVAAFLFIEVGVSAYQGAGPLLTSKTYLEAASGILAVEGYHGGAVRSLIYSKGIETPSVINDANGVSNARDSLDGPTDDDQGITLNGAPNLVPVDANGLTFPRTYGQVLNIGYLTAMQANKGGFFPNGVNGTLNTSAASG